MRNTYLRSKTVADIDKVVARIIRDIGDPPPPLRLELVLDRLRLDRRYYSTAGDGVLCELAHNLKIAGKQVMKRSTLVLDAISKLSLKALFLPDKKRILIDDKLPPIKQRWAEAHEVVHGLIPWHDELMHGDTKQTLSLGCHEQIEAEANYGAGRLLFLQGTFTECLNHRPTMAHIKSLATLFGNSITSTMWRAVEMLDYPAIGVISGHPTRPPERFDPSSPCDYLIRSKTFVAAFGSVEEVRLFQTVRGYCSKAARGPLGEAEVVLVADDGEEHVFAFETFYNGYQALTLGLHQSCRRAMISV